LNILLTFVYVYVHLCVCVCARVCVCVCPEPIRPSDASVTSFNKTHATLEWTAPGTAVTTEFLVTYNSSFWKESKEFRVNDGSNRLAVDGLKAGTRYVFRVHTVSGDGVSPPFCVKVFTGEAS